MIPMKTQNTQKKDRVFFRYNFEFWIQLLKVKWNEPVPKTKNKIQFNSLISLNNFCQFDHLFKYVSKWNNLKNKK